MVTATELKTATEEKLTGQAGIDPATGKPQDTELPTGTEIDPTLVTEKSNELLSGQPLGTTPTITTDTASTSNLDIAVPQSPKTASSYSAYIAPNTPTALAASGTLSSQALNW